MLDKVFSCSQFSQNQTFFLAMVLICSSRLQNKIDFVTIGPKERGWTADCLLSLSSEQSPVLHTAQRPGRQPTAGPGLGRPPRWAHYTLAEGGELLQAWAGWPGKSTHSLPCTKHSIIGFSQPQLSALVLHSALADFTESPSEEQVTPKPSQATVQQSCSTTTCWSPFSPSIKNRLYGILNNTSNTLR